MVAVSLLACLIVLVWDMAQDPKSQWVVVNFTVTENGKQVGHGLRMKKGTAEAMGLSSSLFSVGFVKKTVKHNSTTRRLYPGAPAIPVTGKDQVQAVAIGPRQSRSRTNKKLILRGHGANKEATIYFTGKQSRVVEWLNDHSTIDWTLFGNSMGLYSVRGKRLTLKTAPIA